MQLSLGFSPCPNDTFIFEALIHQKIPTYGLTFEAVIADVEELNRRALAGSLHITKLSYHALAYVLPHYQLLHAGSALGNNCGPLLIARDDLPLSAIPNSTIAIPGRYTTANFLLSFAFPAAQQKIPFLFSDIETAVLNQIVDLGVIIHENRFTYIEKDLYKIMDLGEYWEQTTQLPIPLGGIVIDRQLPLEVKQQVNRLLRQSVEYAFQNAASTMPYVRQYAQEMDESVMQQHIDLYVNQYTIDLGNTGQQAIERFFSEGYHHQIIPQHDIQDLFVPN